MNDPIVALAFVSIFHVIGGISLKTDPFFGLVLGCIFGGVGAVVFILGLRSLLQR